jgi:hypothetical protein
MPWYIFAFTRAGVDAGENGKFIRSTRTVWESSGNPADFALFGTHEIKDPDGIDVTLYYLSPAAQKYCSDGFFTRWQPNQITDIKPLREGLKVEVGTAEALQLLD